ncbi:class I SAM-dependent methyltransferase [Paenibacillus pasadenensis]|uniref:class I SAM-dependent methyltransferase n=1 Tax=Paenibacillus pasadenensis TaxID=217090 RepID=UPI002041B6DC|nr:class I SAM-dependent methyltransferase [Paenibacillus pasadenensis]MCM3746762.1 class I SAM-dependent methyltransferase [Paenibacillus pasadenensis]
MSEWFEKSFGDDYLIVYRHRNWKQAEQEVAQLAARLDIQPGARIADIGCGMGRHSLALSRLGYIVVGMDLSEALLEEANRQNSGGEVEFVQGDMRKIPLEDEGFDAVVNLFTSFGYFERDEEHIEVLREIRRILKPGGRFLIDFLNPDQVRTSLVPESKRTDDSSGTLIMERRWIQDGRVVKCIRLSDGEGGRVREYTESVRLLDEDWFRSALLEAGLVLDAVSGGYGGEAYDRSASKRLILFGRRP